MTILSSLHRGLVSGAEVTMLIFLVNGAFSMVLKTGAFNAFLGSLLRRFSSRAKLVIPVFFLTFAVLSSTFGMWNEYNGLIPVFMGLGVALGYDALAGFAILELGKGIGWSAATLNPFSVPVSQGIAGVPIFSGMGIRVVSFVIFSTLGIAYIFYYGQKVSKNPSKSLILGDKLDINFNREEIINTKTTKSRCGFFWKSSYPWLPFLRLSEIRMGQRGTGWYLCADGRICRRCQRMGTKQNG